jgi:hypothetical protein
VGNAIYKNTERGKEAEAKQAEEVARAAEKAKKPPVDLGQAQVLTRKNIMGYVTMGNLGTLVVLGVGLMIPPLLVWIWGATQGRRWDWGLPEPVHKLKLKPVAKVGGPADTGPKK